MDRAFHCAKKVLVREAQLDMFSDVMRAAASSWKRFRRMSGAIEEFAKLNDVRAVKYSDSKRLVFFDVRRPPLKPPPQLLPPTARGIIAWDCY